MPENQSVAGQQTETKANLCGDCDGFNVATCKNPTSDRFKGRVDKKAAACELFKHI